MKKFLLAIFVIIMLGYSAFSLYMVFGMSGTTEVENTQQVSPLFEAYAELEFSDLASEYRDAENGLVTEEFVRRVTDFITQQEHLEAVIQELALKDYSAETFGARIQVKAHEAEKATIVVTTLDENEYTAADLCNGIIAVLKANDLDGAYSEVTVGDVGTA